MIQITERFLQKGSKKRVGTTRPIKGLTIHSTGNPNSTADNERRWLDNPSNISEVAWHLVIDQKECIQAMPFNEFVWHAQQGSHSTIGLEICESGNRAQTVERAAELAAQILHQHQLTIEQMYRHEDWYKKGCPGIFKANNWEGWRTFRSKVNTYLNAYNKTDSKPANKPVPDYKVAPMKNLSKVIDFDYDQWFNRIDESMPVWATFAFLEKIYNKTK